MRAPDAAALLAFGRVTVFGLWFVQVLVTPIARYSELPAQMFVAPGALRLVPGGALAALIASPALLVGLKAALLLGCLLLVLGVRPFRAVAVPVVVLLVLFDGLDKGFNDFVHHAQMGILFAAAILCLFPAADALSVMGRPRAPAAPAVYAAGVLSVAAFLCAAYAFIGTNRVVAGGFAIFTGDAIVAYMATQSINYSAYDFDYGLLALRYGWLAVFFKTGFAVTTLFEVFSPACLLSTWFRRVWMAVIVPFHLSTLFTMNIFFWHNIFLIAVFIAPIGILMRGLERGAPTGRLDGLRLVGDAAGAGAAQ